MFIGAVLEAVNECEAGNSPPDTGRGGCAIKKKMRSHRSGADGVVGIAAMSRNAFFKRGSILDHYYCFALSGSRFAPVRSVKGGFATSS